MKDWLQYIVTQSISHALIIVFLVTFLESLALIGLILPGIVFMTTLGALIGNDQLPIHPAWIIGMIGCLLGDYLSYYVGWKCKNWIKKINLINKNILLFNKIKQTLYQYGMFTIFFGKFIGPMRPLVPMIAGMIKLPIKKFILPSLIGSFFWPLIYFLPGIITGIIIKHPGYKKNNSIKWILISLLIFIWINCWLIWSCWNNKKKYKLFEKISKKKLILLAITNLIISMIGLFYIKKYMNHIMIIKEILMKIFYF
ncbi:Inner membrane protein YabI [Buchnera aphidicola (Symydobius americanus)]